MITTQDENRIHLFMANATAAAEDEKGTLSYTSHVQTARLALYNMSSEAKRVALEAYTLEFGKEWTYEATK